MMRDAQIPAWIISTLTLATVTEARRSVFTLFTLIVASLALVFIFTLAALTYGRLRRRVRDRDAQRRSTTAHVDAWRESGRRQSGLSRDRALPSDHGPVDEPE